MAERSDTQHDRHLLRLAHLEELPQVRCPLQSKTPSVSST